MTTRPDRSPTPSRAAAGAVVPAAKASSSKPAEATEAAERPSTWTQWLLGWVVAPGAFVGALFAVGVHLGARGPDAWYTRAAVWVAGWLG
jgi:hypothetical protein